MKFSLAPFSNFQLCAPTLQASRGDEVVWYVIVHPDAGRDTLIAARSVPFLSLIPILIDEVYLFRGGKLFSCSLLWSLTRSNAPLHLSLLVGLGVSPV